jgi:hypothetical protein
LESGFFQSLLDTARKISLCEIEEVMQPARFSQSTVYPFELIASAFFQTKAHH